VLLPWHFVFYLSYLLMPVPRCRALTHGLAGDRQAMLQWGSNDIAEIVFCSFFNGV